MADPEQLAREKIDALLGPCGWTVQTLNRNTLDKSARVVISTIQRAYSMLKGETEPPSDLDDLKIDAAESLYKEALPDEYNSNLAMKRPRA